MEGVGGKAAGGIGAAALHTQDKVADVALDADLGGQG